MFLLKMLCAYQIQFDHTTKLEWNQLNSGVILPLYVSQLFAQVISIAHTHTHEHILSRECHSTKISISLLFYLR